MVAATKAATCRAEIVGIKGGRLGLRAGTAAGAVVMKPVLAIKPGSCQLGMANAAPANERELDGL